MAVKANMQGPISNIKIILLGKEIPVIKLVMKLSFNGYSYKAIIGHEII